MMEILKKKNSLILGIIFFGTVGFILVGFLRSLFFPDSSYNFIGKIGKARLYQDSPVVQIIKAKRENLSGLKVSIGNTENMQSGEKMNLAIFEENCQNIIREGEITSKTSTSGTYYQWSFPTLSDSLNKKYCFKATFISENGYRGKKSDLPYIETSAISSSEPVSFLETETMKTSEGKSLVIRPIYRDASLGANLEELNDRMSQYKPGFLKGGYLNFIILFGIILSLLIVAILTN